MIQTEVREQDNAARTSIEKQGSRQDHLPPGISGTDAVQVQEQCEITRRSVAAIGAETAAVSRELEKVGARLEAAALTGPEREKLRVQRRNLQQRIEDLREDLDAGNRRIEHLERLVQSHAVESACDRRGAAQKAGGEVADEMRSTLRTLESLFNRWGQHRSEEQLAVNILRSIAPERVNALATYSYATAVDSSLELALKAVFSELHRMERGLVRRG